MLGYLKSGQLASLTSEDKRSFTKEVIPEEGHSQKGGERGRKGTPGGEQHMQRAWGHGIFDAKKGEVSAACWSELEGEKGATQRSEGFQEQEIKPTLRQLLWELNELRYSMYLNCLEHKKTNKVIMREMFNNLQTIVGSPYFWHTAKFRQQVFLLKESQALSASPAQFLWLQTKRILDSLPFLPLTFNPSPSLIALLPTSSTLLLAHLHNCHTQCPSQPWGESLEKPSTYEGLHAGMLLGSIAMWQTGSGCGTEG